MNEARWKAQAERCQTGQEAAGIVKGVLTDVAEPSAIAQFGVDLTAIAGLLAWFLGAGKRHRAE